MPLPLRFNQCATTGYLLAAIVFGAPTVHARTLNPGESETVTNPPVPEAWSVSQGGTLTINNANALSITSQNANIIFNGGQSERIEARDASVLSLTGATVNSSTGRGAISLSDSSATIDNGTITSTNSFGLVLGRNINTPTSSSATVTGNSVITGATGGANAVGFAVLNLANSTVRGTGATSYGVQLGGATLSSTGSTISGGQDGLQIITDNTGVNASTVILDSTRVTGGTGSAIVLGSSGDPGTVATINVLGSSELLGGNGTLLQATNRSTANFNVDASVLKGNIVADTGSTVSLVMQNGSSLAGNLQNVTQVSLDTGSALNGDVQAQPGTNATVRLDNSSVLTGQINNTSSVTINNVAQWVMTRDNTVQQLTLNNGVVRMGTNEQFLRLDVANLSGTSTIVMGTDLSTGTTDFLNVTGTASGQHLLRISATGNDPITAEPVKVGNIASGDAAFALEGGQMDAGTFTYKMLKDGEGLYLQTDKETVSTSTDTALALAGSARSVMNAEMAMLSDQLGDRGMSTRPDASLRAMNDPSVKNLSNSVWVRTYGNQYSVDNAYGDGYTQNQTGITAGADTTVELAGRSWVMGGFVGSSHTRMDLKYGSTATVESLNAGVYGSTFDVESGVFVNVMAKVNQFDNKAKVTMSDGTRAKGDFKALGISGSVAVGKHIRMKNNYFVEPQVQLATGFTQSDNYRLDNGLEVKSDAMRSLQGKVGIKGGREIALDNGGVLEPSLFTAVNHEFVKTNEVKINDNAFDDDRASSSVEYGAGVKWTPAQKEWQVSGQVGGSKGTTVSQDWSGSVRLSYFF